MNTQLNLEKKELRKQIRNSLKSTSGLNIIEKTKMRFDNENECKMFLRKIPAYKDAKTIFAYLPLWDEFPTEGILKAAFSDGKQIGLPVVQGKDILFRKVSFKGLENTESIKSGSFGIPEPTETCPLLYPVSDISSLLPLIILTPGRAFTKHGERMGRGGGFYDVFFSSLFAKAGNLRSKITTAGICYRMQIISELPVDSHDIKVDIVITE